jgi:hypothetical protein
MTIDTIVRLLEIAVPILIAFLLPSPLGKRIPANVARALARIQPGTIEEVVDHLATPTARKDTAADLLVRLAGKESINLTPECSAQIVDALTKLYKVRIGNARR